MTVLVILKYRNVMLHTFHDHTIWDTWFCVSDKCVIEDSFGTPRGAAADHLIIFPGPAEFKAHNLGLLDIGPDG